MTASCAASGRDTLRRVPLLAGWEMASSEDARTEDTIGYLTFVPAQVPGTVASALRTQGMRQTANGGSLDATEYWFRCRFHSELPEPDEELTLEIGGIATLSEAWFNGSQILQSSSMFASHRVDVSRLVKRSNELLIVCRSLTAGLRARRGQPPQARWRTRLVAEQQLRWFRTALLGRAPAFGFEAPPVGPWRPVTLVRQNHIVVEHKSRRIEFDGDAAIVRTELRVRALHHGAHPVAGQIRVGQWTAPIEWEESGDRCLGQSILRIPGLTSGERWWPHTHGESVLHPFSAELQLGDGSEIIVDDVPVGFRSVAFDNAPGDKTKLLVNRIPVFCRGVVWTPPDPVSLTASDTSVRQRLELLRDGGFNLIRLAGTAVYEDDAFHNLCDELGLVVWQDMMYANMDYPFADSAFWDAACAEAECELSRVSRHASSAVICGNSEIEQQVAMLGLDPTVDRRVFFDEELPRIVERCCPGVPYIPSAPTGGDLPFRTNIGVANYFGVGAYLRPLEDARRADVRFASECLAFANVPEPEVIDRMALAIEGGISPTHPAWKRGVPRDTGAGWDFEDVRDHYLKLLYSLEPEALRHTDTRRYWEISRMVSGEVMAEVFGEWRRPASPCGGGIVLWSADLEPGAGWGILDSEGFPKAAYWFLKRALAPCTVWTTDEGLNGVDVHVSNDGPSVLDAWLRVALYANGERKIAEAERAISVRAHSGVTWGVEQILGRFVDASCAYRFGPPGHDLITASLALRRGDGAIAQSFRFPAGRTAQRVPISDLGIVARSLIRMDGSAEVHVSARRFANGVRVKAANALADDSYFGIEPGGHRNIVLRPLVPGDPPSGLVLTAVNAEGRIPIATERAA